MFMRIKGEGFSEYVYKEIMNITDHSILYINDVKYDSGNKIVYLSIERYPFMKMKKKLLGIIETPMYDRKLRIRSSVVIKQVSNCKIENNYGNKVSETIIGGGIVVRDHKIFVSSQDDLHGKLFYFIEIDLSAVDITISDLGDE